MIIWIVCIELWEVYINFIWSRFGIGCHLLAFSINMADVKYCTASPINNFEGFLHIFYCRIKNFTDSLTQKLICQVGWQGRVQNNRNLPHDVRSPDCRVHTQTNFISVWMSKFHESSLSNCIPFVLTGENWIINNDGK